MITRIIDNPNGSREKITDISIEYEDIRFDKVTNAIKLKVILMKKLINQLKK